MNDELKPVVNSAYTAESFDDEILLYSKEGTQAVYLNDSAHAVWLLCKEDMNVGQMIAYLNEVYPDQKDQIRGDVLKTIKLLQKNNVIELVDE